jgi:hypothetical protein
MATWRETLAEIVRNNKAFRALVDESVVELNEASEALRNEGITTEAEVALPSGGTLRSGGGGVRIQVGEKQSEAKGAVFVARAEAVKALPELLALIAASIAGEKEAEETAATAEAVKPGGK